MTVVLTVFVAVIVTIFLRLSVCLPAYTRRKTKVKKQKLKTMIVFGSGGHTTEMIMLIKKLPLHQYGPFMLVLSHSDTTSAAKVEASNSPILPHSKWITVHRSREVKQSWMTTIVTSSVAMIQSFLIVIAEPPDLIICNGPGTCVPLCYCAFSLKMLGLRDISIVFVESFCRVDSLSLTGKLLYAISDKFLVQWPQLCQKYHRAEYLGDFMTDE